ncbi:hypothetical protein [Brevundimonas sp.]|uniref:hypothetical protein n=1 Tax=Brevundimonas sp. TaxID=1871086 RepID=UPI001A29E2F4|nr:hypothetical protein [Brevundimonas sp.]MBJ7484197.1 hypothetical protein [Brevundimonas sp.]
MRIADASVWINLIATERAHVILSATSVPLRITDVALAELERGRSKGRQAADEMAGLLHMGLTEVVALAAEDEALFLSLVSGAAAETLDDGEAATLACAYRLGAGALIDERKATQIAAKRFETLTVLSTVDLLLSPEVRSACGEDLGDVLFAALTGARMCVPDHHADEIVRVVGAERAMRCHSLPARVRRPAG